MRITRRHRVLTAATVAALALALAACGTGGVAGSSRAAAPMEPPTATRASEREAGSVALVATDAGITAVEEGTATELWSAPGAVAALDGSSVFARDSGTLVRLDPRTGEATASWPVDAALNPVVVAPDGRWVALTERAGYDPSEPPAATTTLVVLRGESGTVRADLELSGDVEPEAFSTDGSQLVVLEHRGPIYRVETLQLATGLRYPTIDEDKNEIGDMAGERVRGVLSADRRLLATLYRRADSARPGAFVHVLHLDGWTYCVGLPEEFGRGPDGSLAIERHGDDVVVIGEAADRRARFSLSALQSLGAAQLDVEVTAGAGPRADAPYRSVPGFRGLVAVIPPPASAPASPSSAGAPGSPPGAVGS